MFLEYHIPHLQGKLSGQGLEDQLPTIALVAHYDSTGMIPVSNNFFTKVHFTVYQNFVLTKS